MDTVFGTYSTPALTLTNLRARRTGVQHRHVIQPLDPEPGDAVTISVVTSGGLGIEAVALYFTTDGSIPFGRRGIAETGTTIPFERVKIEWDSALWGYVHHWQAVVSGQKDGTLVQYAISAWSENGKEHFADWPNVDETVHHATMQHFGNPGGERPLEHSAHFLGQRVFNYHVDFLRPPEWAERATIYHLLVDRFYPGDEKEWLSANTTESAVCGGTLWGVCDRLDYLADLGVDALWLSPTWAASSWHGYDVSDYRRTEPRIGGDEALRAVVEGAHERGIRVLLDMVCNHLSNEHPHFVEALRDDTSRYRDWFMFDDRVANGYHSFFGVPGMPRINLDYPPAREWMIENAVYWMREFDIDGYRLDVADGPGPNFWTHFRNAVRAVKADALIFGEIIDTPERLRTYAGRLDGCLDFLLNDALRKTFGWGIMSETELTAFIADNDAYYPDTLIRFAFFDNHDMDRFAWAAGNDMQKVMQAASYLLDLPQPVVIYYGTEVGMEQPMSIEEVGGFRATRDPMVWGEDGNEEVLTFFQNAIAARP